MSSPQALADEVLRLMQKLALLLTDDEVNELLDHVIIGAQAFKEGFNDDKVDTGDLNRPGT